MSARVSILILLAALVGGSSAAETATPLPPVPPSPIESFRRWLQLPAEEREKELAGYPEPKREILRKKLAAYEAMPPEQREARLLNLELRWYLQPLMKTPPAERGNYLQMIPERLHEPVKARLEHWDRLEERTRTEIMADEQKRELATRYFVHSRRTTPGSTARVLPPMPTGLQEHFARLERRSAASRAKIPRHLNHFFELGPEAQRAALEEFSETERQEMQKALNAFGQLSPADRRRAVESFGRFANMSPEERTSFLRNAARWQEFTPEERAIWRELVTKLPPMPPDPSRVPPMPPVPREGAARKVAATNQNSPTVNSGN